MQITIKKGAKKEEIQKDMAELKSEDNPNSLSNFSGKLKGIFGDGLEYQKKLRNKWG